MKRYNGISRFATTAIALLGLAAGCSNQAFQFGWQSEFSTPPPAVNPVITPINPFIPPDPTPVPGAPTHNQSFTQTYATNVDILWVIDSSGSMSNNQSAISANASAFTSRLASASVNYKIMIITTDVSTVSSPTNVCGQDSQGHSKAAQGAYITNAADFADCALVGDNGSGKEEGLEAARRALDSQYPKGLWNTSASAAPLNAGFLRDGAALQIVYVSDEEDEPDARDPGSNSWDGKAGVSAANLLSLRQEMPMSPVVASNGNTNPLADGGHYFDIRYRDFPLVANHVAFLHGLETGGRNVTAHSIVTTSVDGSDECHTRSSTEEIGQRYIAVANYMGGSVSDICGSWANTMDEIGLQASGLKKCFTLESVPTDRSSFVVQVGASTLTGAQYYFVPTGNQICLNTIPPVGTVIQISYK